MLPLRDSEWRPCRTYLCSESQTARPSSMNTSCLAGSEHSHSAVAKFRLEARRLQHDVRLRKGHNARFSTPFCMGCFELSNCAPPARAELCETELCDAFNTQRLKPACRSATQSGSLAYRMREHGVGTPSCLAPWSAAALVFFRLVA